MYDPARVRRLRNGSSDDDDRDGARYLVDELKSAILRGASNPQGSMGTRFRDLYTALEATAERLGTTFALEQDSLGAFVRSHPELPRAPQLLRAAIVDRPFERLLDHLDDPPTVRLMEPVQPVATGWQKVDEEIVELRAAAAAASTGHQRGAVARLCREVFVSLADAAYDEGLHGPLAPKAHGQGGGTVKDRIHQVIASRAGSGDLADLRVLATKALNFANSLQHHKEPMEVEAMVCADATIFVATAVRRLCA